MLKNLKDNPGSRPGVKKYWHFLTILSSQDFLQLALFQDFQPLAFWPFKFFVLAHGPVLTDSFPRVKIVLQTLLN
jgi:hypothetical protein